jgi:hypothetical protein
VTDRTEHACKVLLTELNLAVTDRARAAAGTRATLRDAVCDYVAVEQARGISLKRIIETVKEILRKAEKKAFTASVGTEKADDDLAKQLVDWCVEFHFAALSASG